MEAETTRPATTKEVVTASQKVALVELRIRDAVNGTLYTTLADPKDTVIDLQRHLSCMCGLGSTRGRLLLIRKGKLLRNEVSFQSLGMSPTEVLAIVEDPGGVCRRQAL